MTPTDRRSLHREAPAYVVHFDGGYVVRAGSTQTRETLTFEQAHTVAAIHNEARTNIAFAEALRVERAETVA